MIADRTQPKTVASFAAALADCDSSGLAVSVEGGNTLRALGTMPKRVDVVLSTTKLNALLAHEYQDLTCSTQAGISLAHFAEKLAQHGQFVPIDAPLRRKATIGGTIAAGWLGPRRHYYGRLRDFVIGSQVILADGTIAHAGGMVVKNVSGYDMSKLYIGSFGTLGVITQLNFKTLPLPARRRALMAKLPEGSRYKVVTQIAALAVVPVTACCIEGFRKSIDGEDGVDGRVFILIEGSNALIERATREVRSALGRAGVPETTIVDAGAAEMLERIVDAQIASIGERSITYRMIGSAETVEARATALRDAANRCELFTDVLFDVMNGEVFLRVSERDSRAFAEKIEPCDDQLRALDGTSTIVAGEAPIRSALNPWGAAPGAIEKMRSIKRHFDPKGTLNPGRFIGEI